MIYISLHGVPPSFVLISSLSISILCKVFSLPASFHVSYDGRCFMLILWSTPNGSARVRSQSLSDACNVTQAALGSRSTEATASHRTDVAGETACMLCNTAPFLDVRRDRPSAVVHIPPTAFLFRCIFVPSVYDIRICNACSSLAHYVTPILHLGACFFLNRLLSPVPPTLVSGHMALSAFVSYAHIVGYSRD